MGPKTPKYCKRAARRSVAPRELVELMKHSRSVYARCLLTQLLFKLSRNNSVCWNVRMSYLYCLCPYTSFNVAHAVASECLV